MFFRENKSIVDIFYPFRKIQSYNTLIKYTENFNYFIDINTYYSNSGGGDTNLIIKK